jgi:hypothetical protein
MAHPINPRNVAPKVFPIVVATAILTEEAQQGDGGRNDHKETNIVEGMTAMYIYPWLTEWLHSIIRDN